MGQVFSCEFCGISKNTVSYRSPPVAASREALLFLLQGTPCIIKGGTMSMEGTRKVRGLVKSASIG